MLQVAQPAQVGQGRLLSSDNAHEFRENWRSLKKISRMILTNASKPPGSATASLQMVMTAAMACSMFTAAMAKQSDPLFGSSRGLWMQKHVFLFSVSNSTSFASTEAATRAVFRLGWSVLGFLTRIRCRALVGVAVRGVVGVFGVSTADVDDLLDSFGFPKVGSPTDSRSVL